jgi:hypothetical protein
MKERDHLKDINMDDRMILKQILRSRLGGYGLDSSGSR